MRPNASAEHVDAFVTFAEHLNFTRAARARHISQPALHTQIKKLQESLGVTLYTRKGPRLVLTPEGERVVAFGRQSREQLHTLVAELHHRTVRGPVIFAAGEGSYLYLVGPAIQRFSASHADTPLRLLVRDHEGTAAAVRTGEAHLGVASVDEPPADLTATVLTQVPQVLALPKTHPLASKKRIQLSDLHRLPLVLPPEGRPHRTLVAHAFRAQNVHLTVAVEASGWELLVHFASLGLGPTIVNAFCRIPPTMVARPIPQLPSRIYYLLQRSSTKSGPVANLEQALRQTASTWRLSAKLSIAQSAEP